VNGSVFAYSRAGNALAKTVAGKLPGSWRLYTVARLAEAPFQAMGEPVREFYGERFLESDALVFIGACGIAVRAIAPFVRDKRTDPAVLCVDELGRFVIPLLSGHIGGANDLARFLAEQIGAAWVVTTATDVHRRFSVDAWAARQGLTIDDMQAAKAVSAAILEGAVPLKSDFPIATGLPAGVIAGQEGAVGIYLTAGLRRPFETTLRLIPKVLHLGIGCRRGVSAEAVAQAVEKALAHGGLDIQAVKCAASIDIKREEPGLLAYCREAGIPIRFYSAGTLMAVEGDFTASEFVKKTTGADNVCERAAMVEAGRLLVKKTALNGVTVAVAAENWEAHFEE